MKKADAHSYSTRRIRTQSISARQQLDYDIRQRASIRIARQFLRSREFMSCKTLACYLPTWDEVDTHLIIEHAWRANKRIFAPIVDPNGRMQFHKMQRDTTLVQNAFGIWEPVSADTIEPRHLDVVVTPLVAFDENLHRIGMGGGYFDRCFSFLGTRQLWFRPKLIGLAFDCQKIEKIKPNPWDIRLYRIVSAGV